MSPLSRAGGQGRGNRAPPPPSPGLAQPRLSGPRARRGAGREPQPGARANASARRRPTRRAPRPRQVTLIGRRGPRSPAARWFATLHPLASAPAPASTSAFPCRAERPGREECGRDAAAAPAPGEGGGAAAGRRVGGRKSPGRRGRGGLHWPGLPGSDSHARRAARIRAESLIRGEAETPPRREELGAPALPSCDRTDLRCVLPGRTPSRAPGVVAERNPVLTRASPLGLRRWLGGGREFRVPPQQQKGNSFSSRG